MPELDDPRDRRGDFRLGRQPAGESSLRDVTVRQPITQDVFDPRTGQQLAANFGGTQFDTSGNIPAPATAIPPVPPVDGGNGNDALRPATENLLSVEEMSDAQLAQAIAQAQQPAPDLPLIGGLISGLNAISLSQMQAEQRRRSAETAGGGGQPSDSSLNDASRSATGERTSNPGGQGGF